MTGSDLEDSITKISREIPFQEKTELGEVFDNLDNDVQDPKTNMSKIDFNSRLTGLDIKNIIVVDELISLGILPSSCRITTQKKRLSVSLLGKGREEKVQISSASRGATLEGRSGGFFSKLFNPRE